jgi:hypothetical protein
MKKMRKIEKQGVQIAGTDENYSIGRNVPLLSPM